ncbi:MAG: hypothetical protein KAU26_02910 [Methylococcales bacterium]|nr:hypothetical protein [Methylococcales bacterium]
MHVSNQQVKIMNDIFGHYYICMMELLIVILIIGILFALTLPVYQDNMAAAKNSELVLMGSGLATRASIHYAVSGQWPEPFKNENNGKYAGASYWKNNATLVVEKNEARVDKGQLSFQGFMQKDEKKTETGIVLWLCGYKTHPMIDSTKIKSQTTIPPRQLPFTCR